MNASIARVATAMRGDGETVAPTRMATEALFASYVGFVWRSLQQLGVREADLDDQVQEVFLIAHRRLADWDGRYPRGWLYAIARRCASAYRRCSHRRYEQPSDAIPEESDTRDPGARMDLERAWRALDALHEDKRAVFILHELEEMSMREVAEAIGCSVFTAYSRLYAARRELARMLEEAP